MTLTATRTKPRLSKAVIREHRPTRESIRDAFCGDSHVVAGGVDTDRGEWSEVWEDHEREALEPPPELTPTEWSEKHIHLTDSARPGPFRVDAAPYLELPMNLCNAPGVVQINVEKGVQGGFSTAFCYV